MQQGVVQCSVVGCNVVQCVYCTGNLVSMWNSVVQYWCQTGVGDSDGVFDSDGDGHSDTCDGDSHADTCDGVGDGDDRSVILLIVMV